MSSDVAEIEHRELRGAIEYAVAMGDELTKRRRADLVPSELRAQFGKARIPTGALGRLRRAIDGDERFRSAIAAGAVPELVDPVGRLWLQRPDGWDVEALALIAEASRQDEEHDARSALRREEKRRLAAEQVAVRLRVDLDEQRSALAAFEHEVDVLRADLVKADEAKEELRAEMIDLRNEARHARDREAAARARLEAELASRTPTSSEEPGAKRGDSAGSDDAADERAGDDGALTAPSVDLAELAEVAHAAREVSERAEALLASTVSTGETTSPTRRERRRPMPLPGGLIASSRGAAEFLLRSDAAVLVDGYNVAKLGWPTRSLAAQRDILLDALENTARRFGTDVTVVFDGTTVVGAHTTRRRLLRVVYSPEGVIADDVIRDEVRRLPSSRPVVVVTNDAEIVTDVRALGANVVPSNALLAAI